MICFLHIGTEKTGTSTLQSFFNLNRDRVTEYGFRYTKSAGRENNWMLPVAAYDPERRDNFTRANNITSNSSLSAFQQKTIRLLSNEISSISQHKIVFSSEHIHSRLKKISEIERLKDILVDLGMTKFRIIVYLRNPADAANSLHSTAIKAGGTIKLPPSPNAEYNDNLCNHKNTLLKYIGVFGKEAVIPRIFDVDDLYKKSIINDFLKVIGLPWCDNYEVPSRLNESISCFGLEILRRFNEKVPVFFGSTTLNPLRKNIVEYFEHSFGNEKYLMPKQLYKAYQDKYKDSNEWVRKQWFPEKLSLFPTKIYTHTKVGATEDELEQITDMLINIWISKENS